MTKTRTRTKRRAPRAGLPNAQRIARIRAAEEIKRLLTTHGIEHKDAEELFTISDWMMSRIRINPAEIALERLNEIIELIHNHVGGSPKVIITKPVKIDNPEPLKPEDFVDAPAPRATRKDEKPDPVIIDTTSLSVQMLAEAIDVRRFTGMTPAELLRAYNAMQNR